MLIASAAPPSALAAEPGAPPATKAAYGALVGVITDSAKFPVAGATVTAINEAGNIRAAVSGSDGIYSFADLAPGDWSVTIQVEGSPEASSPALQAIASKATRHDVVMPGTRAAMVPASTPAAPAAVVPATAAAVAIPEALQSPEPAPENDTVTPWADVGYIGWMNGSTRENSPIFDTKFFTPEIRFDTNYLDDGNHPKDHTIVGSTEEFRSGEFQIEQVSLGGDFHWNGVRARFLSMFGLFSVTTPRNDASQNVGQWDLQGAYRYFSEANAGYHWDVAHGLNVDLGVFVSYIGLFSYYNFDNWTYQPSFVSSNTPWFFNGMRVQFWPTQHLKIEPWLINGWQSYAKFNSHPGFGGQILWIPNDALKLVFNTYTLGQDNFSSVLSNGHPYNGGDPLADVGSLQPQCAGGQLSRVQRIHEDDSVLVKYYDAKGQAGPGLSRAAISLTVDFGCEYGGGVSCTRSRTRRVPGRHVLRSTWFDNDVYAVTWAGAFMNNPGRYLALPRPSTEPRRPAVAYFTSSRGRSSISGIRSSISSTCRRTG